MKKRRTKLEQQVLATIRRCGMLRAGDRAAVAVSGGADSVALVLLLQDLASELGITLLVAHFNHMMRGEESDADERFVADLARDGKLTFVSERADVGAAARRERWNLEDAARRLRYQFFESIVASGRATRVAVAHTADDQAETILGRLIRGTGISGLVGIYPVFGHIVRPLVDVRRSELRRFLERRRQTWREDSSNLDVKRLRARLRHQILPELEREFSGVVRRLCELARLAGDEEIFWSALEEDRFRTWVTETPGGLSISVTNLLVPLDLAHAAAALPGLDLHHVSRALTRRLVRRMLAELHGDRFGFTAHHVEQVIHLACESASGQRIELPASITVEKNFDRLVFGRAMATARGRSGRETATPAPVYEYVVNLPERGSATIAVAELGRKFRLKVIDWPVLASDTKRAAQALDADRLRAPLVLRNWHPGDAYRPRGRGRVQKLKTMFADARIAVRERARWPVLTSAGKLAWARGMPPAEEFAAGSATRAGLVIEEGV